MVQLFCIVGPTAVGKSELSADVAARLGAEIVSADAFQIYQGFDVLSGKPDPATLEMAPHHLIGSVATNEDMSAGKYRALALPVITEISSRRKLPLIVGGSGLYVKALTHGLDDLPAGDSDLREELDPLSVDELRARLTDIDPQSAERVDMKNRRRLVRAIEIAMLSGRSASKQRTQWGSDEIRKDAALEAPPAVANRRSLVRSSDGAGGKGFTHSGVFVFRDREDLYQRINQRVEAMLRNGAIDEVRNAASLSATAQQMIGVGEIRKHLAGETSLAQCTAAIQQATRRYAKRQLTWFRHQTTLEALNLSLLNHNEAVERVVRQAVAGARGE
ncbi:MAG TPA: tRNA (adenosine(37)-N6)-dimethylallyltransferase MiaA [Chthoniobacterales bacterium]|nr:tRNA (adenosine(37)-N6)-dimethylallyltransferase MiaA [Chthoniobacterales bacterium]